MENYAKYLYLAGVITASDMPEHGPRNGKKYWEALSRKDPILLEDVRTFMLKETGLDVEKDEISEKYLPVE